MALGAICGASIQAETPTVKNPYEGICWESVNAYKANFHTHTVKSDGRSEPDHLIKIYAAAGYSVLAIADHDTGGTTRPGEREVPFTSETTWPWTRWIDDSPSRVWERNGMEAAAFYPTLGQNGMLAVRGNELSHHPHILSLFNDCGFDPRPRPDDHQRLTCVQSRGGLAFWAHPSYYIPGAVWGDRFEPTSGSLEDGIQYFGDFIVEYSCLLGMEITPISLNEQNKEHTIALFDGLLDAYYRDHDMYIIGNDDSHATAVHSRAVYTLIFAENLTYEAIRGALEQGHTLVGRRGGPQPRIRRITVDEERSEIAVVAEEVQEIRWLVDGQLAAQGPFLDFSELQDVIVRFELETGGQTFYSQGFHVR